MRRGDGSGTTSSSVDVDDNYAVPRIGFKANVFEPVDCLATFTQPYGADADYGINNAYSPTAVEFKVDTNDYGLTCSTRYRPARASPASLAASPIRKLMPSSRVKPCRRSPFRAWAFSTIPASANSNCRMGP